MMGTSRSAVLVGFVIVMTLAAEGLPQSRSTSGPADEGGWHALAVPGGRATLDALGVPPTMPRALVLTELVRRLQFTNDDRHLLEPAIGELAAGVDALAALERAVAAASPDGRPPVLAAARSSSARGRIRKALEAAGLRLREVERQFVVETGGDADAARLQTRLKRVGVDAADLRLRLMAGETLTIDVPSVALPLPLSPRTWKQSIFEREVPASQLFVTILSDPAARLLYHGLAALDADTRRWFASQRDLLRALYRDPDALRAFALFAPAVRVSGGAVAVPGGARGAGRWSAALDESPSAADRFVRRLFATDNGRLAGLYFLLATADDERQRFILGPAADAADRFVRLASSFVDCYAGELPVYPFGTRPHDPAMLLLEIGVAADGTLAGPIWRRFWSRALEGDSLPDDPARELGDVADDGVVDAAWLVETLCHAGPEAHVSVFETLLFASRVFPAAADADLPEVLLAVRARRLYPGLMQALEQAGIRSPHVYGHLARRAGQIAQVDDVQDAVVLLQQFQGAAALTLGAVRSQTLSSEAGSRLLMSLAAVPVENGRYRGQLAAWLQNEWLPALGIDDHRPLEARVIDALAGPSSDRTPIEWEGLTYVLDIAGERRRQLRLARQRQGGPTFDDVAVLTRVMADLRAPGLTAAAAADLRARLQELAPRLGLTTVADAQFEAAPDVTGRFRNVLRDLERVDEPLRLSRARETAGDLDPVLDVLAGRLLAAWAYAPHLGDAADQSLGDPSLRHEFGLRAQGPLNRVRRWETAWPGDTEGRVRGSLLGLDAALARRSLRRLSSDGLPAEPKLSANEMRAMQLTVALSDARRLTDATRDRIAAAVASGASAVAAAGRDTAALQQVAGLARLSPWRMQGLQWTATEDPEQLRGWFSAAELAWIGGLRPSEADAWGTSFLPAACLCLQLPRVRAPEALLGRSTAGALAYLSAGLMFQIAPVLAHHRLPAALAPGVQRYAMRDVIDRARPAHGADLWAVSTAIGQIDRQRVEDYIGALAANGPLVEFAPGAPSGPRVE
jgi:hypothetical protein